MTATDIGVEDLVRGISVIPFVSQSSARSVEATSLSMGRHTGYSIRSAAHGTSPPGSRSTA